MKTLPSPSFLPCVKLAIIITSFVNACQSLPCELKWVSSSLGKVPLTAVSAVPVASDGQCQCQDQCQYQDRSQDQYQDQEEYVARVFYNDGSLGGAGQWVGGRLKPSDLGVLLVLEGSEQLFKSYSILTNPDHCILRWEEWTASFESGNSFSLEGAVAVEQTKAPVIGRVNIEGEWVGGYYIKGTGLVVTRQGKEVISHPSEMEPGSLAILTAIYPLLKGTLSGFTFDTFDIEIFHDAAIVEVLGSHVFKNNETFDLTESVSMDRSVPELFQFVEKNLEWKGISELDVSLPLWFGTSDVSSKVNLKLDSQGQSQGSGLRSVQTFSIRRQRHFNTTNNSFLVKAGTVTEWCSYGLVPIFPGVASRVTTIKFVATAELQVESESPSSPSKMTHAQLKKILSDHGRREIREDTFSKTVWIKVDGELSGKFILQTFSETIATNVANVTEPFYGKCMQLQGKPLKLKS